MAYSEESEEEEEVEEEEEEVEEEVEEEEEEEEEEEPVKKKRTRKDKKWKDPDKPKRAMSAFFLYSQGNRSRVKEENPSASFGDVARTLAAQFKELPPGEKKKWEKKAAADKARYQEAMKHYVPTEDPTGGRKGKKAKKDPNAPKRNMSAYFLYSVSARPTVKEENPEASFGDIARIISAQFKALTPKERSKWDQKAADDKVRYQREMEAYKEE
ncbi:group protein B1 [Seminavis robusta]|uniref:Group protein B1 n=1 Tax=Seminavis robusta TaxID=568900 RepID=A0A9N8EWB4_9STRA|nr:group protein B1 [Seminavis robusta]|eukprot:Sro2197_g318650.1 group protein B1 (214) ;mRNA; r:1552-2833